MPLSTGGAGTHCKFGINVYEPPLVRTDRGDVYVAGVLVRDCPATGT